MIRSLEMYPGPRADFREACLLLRSDDFDADRVQVLYSKLIVSAERLVGGKMRVLVGTEEDPGQFFASPGMPPAGAEPFFDRVSSNRGFYSLLLRGDGDDDGIFVSRRGFIDPTGGFAQAIRLLQEGQPQRAAMAIHPVLENCPAIHGVHMVLGRCYEAMGDPHDAIESYASELRVSQSPQAAYAIGRILDQRGDRETSRFYFEETLRRDGLNLPALFSLTLAHLYSGEFQAFWRCFQKAYLLAGEDSSVTEIVHRAAGVFSIEEEEVVARAGCTPLSREILEELLLHRMLFENGAFEQAQEAFERFIGGFDDEKLQGSLADLYSEIVRNYVTRVSPWQASRVIPRLHYSLEALAELASDEFVVNYGAALEISFRELRWFLDPLWSSYLVEDLEELAEKHPRLEELGVSLVRVYGNLLEDQVHMRRLDGSRRAQLRIEELLRSQPRNDRLPYTYLTCLTYLARLAADSEDDSLAVSFLRRALELATGGPEAPAPLEHLADALESLAAHLAENARWPLLERILAELSESLAIPEQLATLRGRIAAGLARPLPTELEEFPHLQELGGLAPARGTLRNPVVRSIRRHVGLPVSGAVLVVESDPDGQEIFINGRSVGVTPRRFEEFPTGEYTIGVGSVFKRIHLADARPLRMRFQLPEARIEIDEDPLDPRPPEEARLAEKLALMDADRPGEEALLDVAREDGVRVLSIRQDVTPHAEQKFQSELLSVIERDGPGPLVIDLSRVRWIGSAGIALLARLYEMNGRKQMVVVRGSRPDFRVEGEVCLEVKSAFDYLLRYVPEASSVDLAVDLAKQGGWVN